MSTVSYRDFLTGDVNSARVDEAIRTAMVNMNLAVDQQLAMLTKYIAAIDRAHPQIECSTTPGTGSTINGSQQLQFMVGNRQVRAYWLMIQNNTSGPINFNLNGPADLGSFVLTAGQTYEGWIAACRSVGIYVPSATTLNAASGITVRGMTVPSEAGMS